MVPMNDFSFTPHLSIEELVLELFVGWTDEERKKKQPIQIDLSIFFPRAPLGAVSDELKDTVCYDTCVEKIREVATKKPFHLIEHLAYEIHTALTKELPMHLDLMVKVRKMEPPIPGLRAVSFTFFPSKNKSENEEKKTSRSWDWE